MSKPVFDKAEFYEFCNALKIETKDYGLVTLGSTFFGSQTYLIDEIELGISEGIHYFVILKPRQVGITTLCLALDLYWHFKYPGMQGSLVADTDENKAMFRTTLTLYLEGLPRKWRQPVEENNKTQLVLGNRSRIAYQVAGTRKNHGLGAGKAIAMMHATEVGKWGDVDITSLEASFSDINPLRLYMFESTAYGMGNGFYDMWETAGDSVTQRQVFIGWWRKDTYRVEAETEIYKVYWDGMLNEYETRISEEVRELYDFDIADEQWAWYRWTLAERCKGDEQEMQEKYPSTAEEAFVMTGSQFFSAQKLSDSRKVVDHRPYDIKRFHFGAAFGDTELVECIERTATLKIWQLPERGGWYAIGADPAWGSSDWADRFCINVSRCWADQVEQVAEFCTPDINTTQFAWVLLYLAGAYCDPAQGQHVMINLEINGPGQAVWHEIQTLKRNSFMMKDQAHIAQLLNGLENYLYRRIDAIKPSYNYHTLTSAKEKERYLNVMKDKHEMGQLTINSTECIDEMKNVVREDGMLGVPGRGKDDRVIAQALATICWADFMQVPLIQRGLTRAKAEAEATVSREHQTAGRKVDTYLKQLGVKIRSRDDARIR